MEYLPIKRLREEEYETTLINMANYLRLLSRSPTSHYELDDFTSPSRVYECKTCNRQFPSFQALGGHRASHKKPRLNSNGDSTQGVPAKPKSHECSICGLEFAVGQALGGHMRRHRVITTNYNQSSVLTNLSKSLVKKVNSRRVLSLDLNLTPLENDLKFRKLVPTTVELFT